MLLEARNISHSYHNHRAGGSAREHEVLTGVDLSIAQGEMVGLLGPSGSGKTTLGHILAGLHRPTGGQIYYRGIPLSYPFRGEIRRKIQILFQHPETSFDPRRTLWESFREIYALCRLPWVREEVLAMLEPFGIVQEQRLHRPAQLSGGELQRLALARVLLPRPEFLVLDEPTSMLDVISQAQVMALLDQVRRTRGLACLFITHDEPLCRLVSDRVVRMADGKVTDSPAYEEMKGVTS